MNIDGASGVSRPVGSGSAGPPPAILLKARPTATQLADRLRHPPPEGLELYLDGRDIAGPDWLAPLLDRLAAARPRAPLSLLVEGPLRSLDGSYFDLTVDSAANRDVVDRLIDFGVAIDARAACVHLMAATEDLTGVSPARARGMVQACLPLTRHYAARCRAAGIVPTVENVPPITRMREGRLMTSPVGASPDHLVWLADLVPGLRFTVDTSHAQLFLNAAGGDDGGNAALAALIDSLAASSSARTFAEYIGPLRGRIETGHVSDADGLLGEGLCYGEGSMALDEAVDMLLDEAHWIVAEIIEPDPNQSENMRYAREQIAQRRELRCAVR